MIVSTLESVPGYRITAICGVARGNTIRARHIGSDIVAGLRNLVGGEVSQYTAMLGQSREQALDRMRAEALEHGANAIVGMRLATSTVMQGAAELLAYGTAVIVEPL